jgi:MoaA/NifB/PqqE/SkfB family radical SAM enzyme
MNCTLSGELTDREYLSEMSKKIASLRIPYSGSFEITQRCNLRCAHCYLGHKRDDNGDSAQELKTDKIFSILDEITESGCLYLLITGGEPLLRNDFPEIYRRAKENGLVVTVFTNATLVTDEIASLFSELSPLAVEATLYGATEETYEKITRIRGSFEKCVSGIERLINCGVDLRLKTMLMSLNSHEFHQIRDMAKSYGVKFRLDPAISPMLDGNPSPIELRLAPHEAVEQEFSDPERLKNWISFYERFRDVPATNLLYDCGAGLSSFYIDACGDLRPCLMTGQYGYNLTTGSFKEGWYEFIPSIRKRKAPPGFACKNCSDHLFCGCCPGFFFLETGSETEPVDYLCELGRRRFEKIQDYCKMKDECEERT